MLKKNCENADKALQGTIFSPGIVTLLISSYIPIPNVFVVPFLGCSEEGDTWGRMAEQDEECSCEKRGHEQVRSMIHIRINIFTNSVVLTALTTTIRFVAHTMTLPCFFCAFLTIVFLLQIDHELPGYRRIC